MSKQSMQEPTFLILTALAAGAQHGYGIMTDVARISDGRVRLRAGTLYAALDRLKSDGLVTGDKEEIVDGRLRRYYRITDEGTAELAAEVGRLRANAAIAASRLGLAGGTAWRNARPDDRHRDQVQPDGAAVPAAARPVPQ